MSPSLEGYVRLKNLRSGAIFKTRDGVFGVKANGVYAKNNPQPVCVDLNNGQYIHFPELAETWVKEVTLSMEQCEIDIKTTPASQQLAPGQEGSGD